MRISIGCVKARRWPGMSRSSPLHKVDEFRLTASSLPPFARMQRQEQVRQLDAHGVCRDLGGADAAPGVTDFVRERAQERLLHLSVVAHRLIEVGSRDTDDVDRDGTLGQPRNELGAEAARDDQAGAENRHGTENRGVAVVHDGAEHGR
jgi:hypothetical protein